MLMIPPVTITDAEFVSSSVPDTVETPGVLATGTITCTPLPTVGDTFVVGTQTFTIVASGTALGNVVKSVSNGGQALEIEISLERDIPDIVTVTVNSNVVYLTSAILGAAGNAVVLTEASAGLAVSGSGTLSGGITEIPGDYVEWNSGTSYASGAVVVVTSTHHIYESQSSSNLNHPPATSPTYWEDLGVTNRWRMFDTTVTSQTEQVESIVVAVNPGAIDSVCLLNCIVSSIDIVLDDPTAGEVYNQTITPASASTAGTYLKTDLPDDYPAATLTVTITNTGDTATCGLLACGIKHYLGKTRYGAQIGIIDYSLKETDDFGNFTINERAWSRRSTFPVAVAEADRNSVRQLLNQNRSTPAVFIGNDGANIPAGTMTIMTTYGFIKSDPMDLMKGGDDLVLEIEGMI